MLSRAGQCEVKLYLGSHIFPPLGWYKSTRLKEGGNCTFFEPCVPRRVLARLRTYEQVLFQFSKTYEYSVKLQPLQLFLRYDQAVLLEKYSCLIQSQALLCFFAHYILLW